MVVVKGKGVNASERFLSKLCEKTFLKLWSYPNVYFDKKIKGKGDGKELCDLLVVYANNVIIFSDKRGSIDLDVAVDLSWSRWRRKVILSSVKQIEGSVRVIKNFKERIFLDKDCKIPFPIDIPSNQDIKFHRICVVSGTENASRKIRKRNDGSLGISTAESIPFVISDHINNGEFYHIFDRPGINSVLSEFDTITDLIKYLEVRSDCVSKKLFNFADSEKDLFSQIYFERDFGSSGSYIVNSMPEIIKRGTFESYRSSLEFRSKTIANKASRRWDALIDKFSHHLMAGTAVTVMGIAPTLRSAEMPLRVMAAEPRFMRRELANALGSALGVARRSGKNRFTRSIPSISQIDGSNIVYIFMIMDYEKNSSLYKNYEGYRELRAHFTCLYSEGFLIKNKDIKNSIAISIDGFGGKELSEDLLMMELKDNDSEREKVVLDACERLGLLKESSQNFSFFHAEEFPVRRVFHGY